MGSNKKKYYHVVYVIKNSVIADSSWDKIQRALDTKR